jgi:hypothetical protein
MRCRLRADPPAPPEAPSRVCPQTVSRIRNASTSASGQLTVRADSAFYCSPVEPCRPVGPLSPANPARDMRRSSSGLSPLTRTREPRRRRAEGSHDHPCPRPPERLEPHRRRPGLPQPKPAHQPANHQLAGPAVVDAGNAQRRAGQTRPAVMARQPRRFALDACWCIATDSQLKSGANIGPPSSDNRLSACPARRGAGMSGVPVSRPLVRIVTGRVLRDG